MRGDKRPLRPFGLWSAVHVCGWCTRCEVRDARCEVHGLLSATDRPSGVTFSLTHLWRHNQPPFWRRLAGVTIPPVSACVAFFYTREVGGGEGERVGIACAEARVRRGCGRIGLVVLKGGRYFWLIRTGGCGCVVMRVLLPILISYPIYTPSNILTSSPHLPTPSTSLTHTKPPFPHPAPTPPHEDHCTSYATLALHIAANQTGMR